MSVRVNVKQEIIDHGWIDIKSELRKAKNSYTKVGLPERKDPLPADDGSMPITQMSELVKVGAIQEFGAPNRNIPERSFMRAGFDKSRKLLMDTSTKLYDKILNGTMTTEIAIKILGLFHIDQIKAFINLLKHPANAPSTIRQKGSSNPLVNTGQMRNSIQHEVIINE